MESGLYGILVWQGAKGKAPRLVSQTVFARTGLGTRPHQTLLSLSLVTVSKRCTMKIGLPVVLLVSLMVMISGESRGMNVDGVVDELSRKVADSQVRPNNLWNFSEGQIVR